MLRCRHAARSRSIATPTSCHFCFAKVAGALVGTCPAAFGSGRDSGGHCFWPLRPELINPGDTIHPVAEIGAIFVLFSAGLETSPHDLIQVGRKALLAAVAGVVVPFVLGFANMKWLRDATSEAIFVGTAMVGPA